MIELHQAQAEIVVSAYLRSLDAVPTMLPADKDAVLRSFLAGLGRGPDGVRGELVE